MRRLWRIKIFYRKFFWQIAVVFKQTGAFMCTTFDTSFIFTIKYNITKCFFDFFHVDLVVTLLFLLHEFTAKGELMMVIRTWSWPLKIVNSSAWKVLLSQHVCYGLVKLLVHTFACIGLVHSLLPLNKG